MASVIIPSAYIPSQWSSHNNGGSQYHHHVIGVLHDLLMNELSNDTSVWRKWPIELVHLIMDYLRSNGRLLIFGREAGFDANYSKVYSMDIDTIDDVMSASTSFEPLIRAAAVHLSDRCPWENKWTNIRRAPTSESKWPWYTHVSQRTDSRVTWIAPWNNQIIYRYRKAWGDPLRYLHWNMHEMFPSSSVPTSAITPPATVASSSSVANGEWSLYHDHDVPMPKAISRPDFVTCLVPSSPESTLSNHLIMIGSSLASKEVHTFNLTTNEWSTLPSMNQVRRHPIMVIDPTTGWIYVFGGSTTAGVTGNLTAEVYNPSIPIGWRMLSGEMPRHTQYYGTAGCYIPSLHAILLFGRDEAIMQLYDITHDVFISLPNTYPPVMEPFLQQLYIVNDRYLVYICDSYKHHASPISVVSGHKTPPIPLISSTAAAALSLSPAAVSSLPQHQSFGYVTDLSQWRVTLSNIKLSLKPMTLQEAITLMVSSLPAAVPLPINGPSAVASPSSSHASPPPSMPYVNPCGIIISSINGIEWIALPLPSSLDDQSLIVNDDDYNTAALFD